MASIDYSSLQQALRAIVPAERLITDPLRTLAYGTDASFYRLIPKIVVQADDEDEVRAILHMSPARGDDETRSLTDTTAALLEKAGYDVVPPSRL